MMVGWIEIDGWIEGRVDGCIDAYEWMDRRMDGLDQIEWVDELMNRWMDGWMNGWMDGWMDICF